VQREGNTYTFIFALIVCMVCSFSVSLVSEGLRAKKELNVLLDIKKNILKAVDLKEPLDPKTGDTAMLALYKEKIEEVVIDKDGNIVEGKTPDEITQGDKLYPLYIYKENGKTASYCFPIEGKGLWSTIYGYLALESDAIFIRGITFYKHGETPGLGAEIEKKWFQDNFKGKCIWDIRGEKLVCPVLVKGKVADLISKEESQYYIDGISGATMTSKGVTAMLDKWLKVYEPFFNKVRKK
jgi:Na+-transporting NADH:ubiquinone oxidoreductase subunit C